MDVLPETARAAAPQIRGRLAPSPTGALHLGNARTFLLAWLSSRSQGGTVVLRIEDLDGPRVKPSTVAGVIEDLRWLGLDWDEGPDRGGPVGPYVQTERQALYAAAWEQLNADGQVYPCRCSRSDIERAASAPHAGDEGPPYPGTCRRRLPAGPANVAGPFEDAPGDAGEVRPVAWRFQVPDAPLRFVDGCCGAQEWALPTSSGDFVVLKGTGTAAYQLAVVVDDHAMRISEVVRGDDLLSSTPRQLALYAALGWDPPRFWHVPLVVGPDGRRLAKRHGDTRIATFRAAGIPAERLVGLLASWSGLGRPGEEWRPADLTSRFAWSKVPRERIVCDQAAALRWLGAKS